MTDRFLLINADDLGLAPGVTRGILELAQGGVVASTSALVTLPWSVEAIRSAGASGLDVGVHLTLSIGTPLSPPATIPSLLAPHGLFPSGFTAARRLALRQVALHEVEREWDAQIEAALDAGAQPTHLDTHGHLHGFPPLARVLVKLARRHGVPSIRSSRAGFIFQPPYVSGLHYIHPAPRTGRTDGTPPAQPDYFAVLTVRGRRTTPRALDALISALPPGVTELVCHPGYVDAELRALDALTTPREREKQILGRPSFKALLEREGVSVIRRADLAGRRVSR